MAMRATLGLVLLGALTGCNTPEPPSIAQATAAKTAAPAHSLQLTNLAAYQLAAARFNSVIRLPKLEETPAEILRAVTTTMTRANTALDAVASCTHDHLTFANTIGALDDLTYEVGLTANRLSLIKETSQSAGLREAATEATKTLAQWSIGLDYREDVFQTVNGFALTLPKLRPEEERLLREILRDYRRAGLELPRNKRDEVEQHRKELTRLMTDFESNITKAQKPVKFAKADLEGVPESFLF